MHTQKKQILASYIGLCLASVLTSGCDSKNNDPLPGNREPFIILSEGVDISPTLKGKAVNIPAAHTNNAWHTVGGNAHHAMGPLKASLSPTLKWKVSIGQGSRDDHRLISNVIVDGNRVYGMDSVGHVFAVDAQDGKVLWSVQTSPDESKDEALGGGVCFGQGMIFASTAFGDVIALNPEDGKEIWRTSLKTPFRNAPTFAEGRLFIISISNETHAVNAQNGEAIWSHSGILEPAALLGNASPAVMDDTVIVAYSSGEVFAFQAHNGQVLWSDTIMPAVRTDTVASIPHIRARPIIDRGQVFILSHGGRMTAIDLKTGSRLWQKFISGIRTPAVSGTNGELQLIKTQDGTLSQTLNFDGKAFISPVVAGETIYLLGDSGTLYAWV